MAGRSRQPSQRRATRDRTLAPNQRQSAGVRGNHRRPQVLSETLDREMGPADRTEGLGVDGVRMYRQQQGHVRRPPAARAT